MDWSLVLASQGIEHTVGWDEATGWILAVAKVDREKALAQIHLYRLENLQWRWRQPLFQPGLFFDWSSLVWVLVNILFYWWSEARADLRTMGMMDGAALAHGEWWRLFTATWLHADIAHLAMNMVFGFLFLGLVLPLTNLSCVARNHCKINLFPNFIASLITQQQGSADGGQSQHSRLRNGCDSQIIKVNIAGIARIVIEHIYSGKRPVKCATPTV
jgi:hypothetical protein